MTDNQTTDKSNIVDHITTRIMYCLTTSDFGFGGNHRESRIIQEAQRELSKWNQSNFGEDMISERDLRNALTDAITQKVADIKGINIENDDARRALYRSGQWKWYNHVSSAVYQVFK